MIAEGNYMARAVAGSVWEAESGALMITLDLEVLDDSASGKRLFARQCIVQRDGTVSQITMDTLREAFGWPGDDPFFFEDSNNYMDREVEIVVVHEEYRGKVSAQVKYINAPGGGRSMPKSADRNAIMAKHGAKFRAMAGNTKTTNTAPPASRPAPPPPAPAAEKAAPPSDMNEAWGTLCDSNPNATQDELTNTWQTTIGKLFPGKSNSDLTPQDWGRVKSEFADEIPY